MQHQDGKNTTIVTKTTPPSESSPTLQHPSVLHNISQLHLTRRLTILLIILGITLLIAVYTIFFMSVTTPSSNTTDRLPTTTQRPPHPLPVAVPAIPDTPTTSYAVNPPDTPRDTASFDFYKNLQPYPDKTEFHLVAKPDTPQSQIGELIHRSGGVIQKVYTNVLFNNPRSYGPFPGEFNVYNFTLSTPLDDDPWSDHGVVGITKKLEIYDSIVSVEIRGDYADRSFQEFPLLAGMGNKILMIDLEHVSPNQDDNKLLLLDLDAKTTTQLYKITSSSNAHNYLWLPKTGQVLVFDDTHEQIVFLKLDGTIAKTISLPTPTTSTTHNQSTQRKFSSIVTSPDKTHLVFYWGDHSFGSPTSDTPVYILDTTQKTLHTIDHSPRANLVYRWTLDDRIYFGWSAAPKGCAGASLLPQYYDLHRSALVTDEQDVESKYMTAPSGNYAVVLNDHPDGVEIPGMCDVVEMGIIDVIMPNGTRIPVERLSLGEFLDFETFLDDNHFVYSITKYESTDDLRPELVETMSDPQYIAYNVSTGEKTSLSAEELQSRKDAQAPKTVSLERVKEFRWVYEDGKYFYKRIEGLIDDTTLYNSYTSPFESNGDLYPRYSSIPLN